jgi:DUF4097 and DUF4098 domain-containing protein YvlB
VSGNVRVRGAGSRLDLTSVSGQVEATGEALASGRLESTSGQVRLDAGLEPDGSLEIETVSGNVTAYLPEGVAAAFRLRTRGGEIHSDLGPPGGGAARSSDEGSLDFTTGRGGASVRVETVSGSIKLVRR